MKLTTFICNNTVEASPMTYAEALREKLVDRDIPNADKVNGWRVFLPSGKTIWLSEEDFNKSCISARDKKLSFSEALDALKGGAKVARREWDRNEFVYLVQGSTFKVSREPLLNIFGKDIEVTYRPHLDKVNADGTCGVYTPTQEDLFATDWEIVR